MKNPTELSALPNELMHAIAGYLKPTDLLPLCLTSRQIHSICLEWIYRAITLENPVQIIRCCKTIVSRKEAAEAVRTLEIACYPGGYPLKNFFTTFVSAVSRIVSNLRVLDMCVPSLLLAIAHISFPRLHTCTLPVSPDIIRFLCINPRMASITIFPEGSRRFDWPLAPIHMPNLEHFDGPDIVACIVVPGSLVSRIALFWPDRPVLEFSRGLAAAASSKADLIELSNLVYSWNPDLLAAVAEHTPRIQFLQIRNMKDFSVPTRRRDQFFAAMDGVLPSLPCLIGLIIVESSSLRPMGIQWISEELDSEFEIVQRWGALSPVLTRLTLPSTTLWLRLGDNIWFPGDPAKEGPATVLCLKWLIKKVLTSSDLPVAYRLAAVVTGGEDGMVILEEALERDGVVPAFDISRNADGSTVISFPSLPLENS
ncbi:hypothetical protein DFH06DRAFT_527164 [Mycena polygramma]|nr:hypothetical protein DFH06DRAFT_527164 [Mycena polygramma]